MAMEQGQGQGQGQESQTEPTNEKNAGAEPATAATPAAASIGRQLMNAKTQDLLSLSQLSSHQTSTARAPTAVTVQREKNASSLKNAISIGGATTGGATFQQIGSQRVNGNAPATAAPTTAANTDSQQVAANGSLIAPTLATASAANKTHVRTSAKKVESKYILPKPQKTDAPMLNYIFDTFSAANKHHHHDQRWVSECS